MKYYTFVVLTYIFQVTKDVERASMCLLTIHLSSSVKYLFEMFAIILIVCFLLVELVGFYMFSECKSISDMTILSGAPAS